MAFSYVCIFLHFCITAAFIVVDVAKLVEECMYTLCGNDGMMWFGLGSVFRTGEVFLSNQSFQLVNATHN